jgi:hypothetical protein
MLRTAMKLVSINDLACISVAIINHELDIPDWSGIATKLKALQQNSAAARGSAGKVPLCTS